MLRYNRIANTGHSRRNSWLLGLSFFVSLFEELSTWLAAGETVDVPLKTMHIEGGYKFCHMLKRDCQDKKYWLRKFTIIQGHFTFYLCACVSRLTATWSQVQTCGLHGPQPCMRWQWLGAITLWLSNLAVRIRDKYCIVYMYSIVFDLNCIDILLSGCQVQVWTTDPQQGGAAPDDEVTTTFGISISVARVFALRGMNNFAMSTQRHFMMRPVRFLQWSQSPSQAPFGFGFT